MSVIIHGVNYIPETEAKSSNIGIAITTHNRNETFNRAIQEQIRYLPAAAFIVGVDDGSKVPVTVPSGVNLIRVDAAEGISQAKNRCIEALYNAGCMEFFLFDDDCWPKVSGWEKPYIESPEPHLAHSWGLVALWRDPTHTAYHACGGTVLYYRREVIERIGGMRDIFGRYGCEHVNLSDRIHNAGLTTWRYADITSAEELFYECDRYEKQSHKSTVSAADLEHNKNTGTALWRSMRDDAEYVEFRQQHDYVVTVLLTGVRDPQRNVNMKADPALIQNLAKSVKVGKLVVLHDQLPEDVSMTTGAGEPVIFEKVSHCINPYFSRWQAVYQWLRANKQARNVWVVDGTDVEQLQNPFNIENGTLYIGQEQATLNSDWLVKNVSDSKISAFLKENPHKTMLNPGTVGGERPIVQEFCHAMVHEWYDDHIDDVQAWERHRIGPFDMATVQYIAYRKFEGRIFYGPRVNTHFKGNKADEFAFWKHK